MKDGQIHQIDENAAKDLEKRIVRLNEIGYSIKTLHNVLIEIDIAECCNNSDFCHLKTNEKHHINEAIMLLGRLTTMETYELAERFGLENPS